MIFAHLPAGFLLTRALLMRHPLPERLGKRLFAGGLIASVLPDLDMIYCIAVDKLTVHHHRYFTHWPLFWLACWGAALGGLWIYRRLSGRHARLSTLQLGFKLFFLNALLHMVLDTIASDMWWLAPFSDTPWKLIDIPARFRPWVLNFTLHWTFALEFLIIATALVVAVFGRRPGYSRTRIAETSCEAAG